MSEGRRDVSNASARASRRTRHATLGIIPAMTDRGLPSADASPACPFVAFEDDDVGVPALGEMVRGARAHDPAADDDNVSCLFHGWMITVERWNGGRVER